MFENSDIIFTSAAGLIGSHLDATADRRVVQAFNLETGARIAAIMRCFFRPADRP